MTDVRPFTARSLQALLCLPGLAQCSASVQVELFIDREALAQISQHSLSYCYYLGGYEYIFVYFMGGMRSVHGLCMPYAKCIARTSDWLARVEGESWAPDDNWVNVTGY
jgi:hypothetical protein